MEGKGGGKAESAQASGTNISCLSKLMTTAKNFANLKLGITGKEKYPGADLDIGYF